jgi:hypothetical protein
MGSGRNLVAERSRERERQSRRERKRKRKRKRERERKISCVAREINRKEEFNAQ